jgi:uncharacterized protein YukE
MIVRPAALRLPSFDGPAAARFCLAHADPAGDPERLREVARHLARTAQTVRASVAELRSLGRAASSWCGTAADAFQAAIEEPKRAHIDDLPPRYEGYAAALSDYAAELTRAVEFVRQARAAVRDALAAHARATPAGQHPGGATAAGCLAAAQRYAAAYNDWVDAADRCISRLTRTDRSDHLHNPHGWHAVVDAAAGVFGNISTLSAALGVLALAICPVAAPILFAVSTATAGVTLAADLDRRYQRGEDVSLADLAVDALGCIPAVDTVRGAAAAGRAARSAEHATDAVTDGAAAFVRPVAASYRATFASAGTAFQTIAKDGLTFRAPALPGWRPLVAGLDKHGQNVAQVPAAWAANASDNHRPGKAFWPEAWQAPFRVEWRPLDEALPPGPARVMVEVVVPDLAVLNRLGAQ